MEEQRTGIVRKLTSFVSKDVDTGFEKQVRVYQEQKDRDCLLLLLIDGNLSEVSLDSIYECRIRDGKDSYRLEGKVIERFMGRPGNMMVFEIQKGVYKS